MLITSNFCICSNIFCRDSNNRQFRDNIYKLYLFFTCVNYDFVSPCPFRLNFPTFFCPPLHVHSYETTPPDYQYALSILQGSQLKGPTCIVVTILSIFGWDHFPWDAWNICSVYIGLDTYELKVNIFIKILAVIYAMLIDRVLEY